MTTPTSLLNTPAGKQWENIGARHHHGINVPLFSLHSDKSCGIGEYTDLLPIITWCKEIGFDIIQLLPLNDTGENPSPYSSISAFALNPIYLGLIDLPYVKNDSELMQRISAMQRLNQSQRVDYKAVLSEKNVFLREYFKKYSEKVITTDPYKNFVIENDWLYPYALFKTLKIQYQWRKCSEWDPSHQNLSQEAYQSLLRQYLSEIVFHIFVQYFCFEQMERAKKEAFSQGVFLKGDIPILIDRESADVWYFPQLFVMQYSSGAPPDMYSAEGQNWGAPVYNWETIEAKDYAWWKERLQVAEKLYHIYRIDHVVGFFRIFAIPLGKSGREGKFLPEDENKWIPQGESIMRAMLEASSMLPIGEDLGTVPPDVRICLHRLGICGTKVMRWERNWNGDRSYIPYEKYSLDSMTTVSTHDSETVKQWWKNNRDDVLEFATFKGWIFESELSQEHLFEILHDSHHSNSLFHINLLQEYLALVPGMTWPKLEDERVNVPGIIADSNWSYKFLPSVEEIISNSDLRLIMQNMLK
jgi:4-alpha-glucanotransferase